MTTFVSNTNTKRFILKGASRIFDPLGLLGPFIVRVKILFQDIRKANLGWDQDVGPELGKRWQVWYGELPALNGIKMDRRALKGSGVMKHELHVFCDASKQAYCAVAYLRTIHEKGQTTTTTLLAKSREALLKQLTVPCLVISSANRITIWKVSDVITAGENQLNVSME